MSGCPEHQWEGKYRLQEGDTYVEAGAFWGRYGLIASHRVGSGGRVILIEGSPRNISVIRQVQKRYGLTNIEIVDGIVWSEDGETDFCVHGNPAGCRKAVSGDLENYPNDIIRVQVYKLDTLFEQLNVDTVNLLCCDVEGAEYEMVKGAEEYLKAKRIMNVALAVYHAPGMPTKIVSFLQNLGYHDVFYSGSAPQYGGIVFGRV